MTNAREIPALRIEVRVSKWFVGLLCVGHAGALAVSAGLAVSRPWLSPCCLAIVSSWVWTLHRYALLTSPQAVVAVEITGESACALRRRSGVWTAGELRPSSYVLPWLVVLHVSGDARWLNRRVALFVDSMPAEAHRRLRVRLRWARYGSDPVDADAPSL